jgi:hypothetical protein
MFSALARIQPAMRPAPEPTSTSTQPPSTDIKRTEVPALTWVKTAEVASFSDFNSLLRLTEAFCALAPKAHKVILKSAVRINVFMVGMELGWCGLL